MTMAIGICAILVSYVLLGCSEATPQDPHDRDPTERDDPPIQSAIQSVVTSVSIDGTEGEHRPRPVPEASGGPATSLSGNETVINGGAFFLSVQPEPGSSVESVIVALEGESFGYYEVDLSNTRRMTSGLLASSSSDQRSNLELRGQISQDVESDFSIVVIATDASGVGMPEVHDFGVIEVGTGSVQISLSWDVDSDVDLHVVDPNGNEIFYGHRSVASGGRLDLDSNAGCRIDGIRNENVTWPDGAAPSGTYTVRVNYWSSCDVTATEYAVTIIYGGEQQVFTGTLTGRGNQGGRGSGIVISTFTL